MILFLLIIFVVWLSFWYLHAYELKINEISEKEFTKQTNNVLNKYETSGDLKVINNMRELE